MIISNKISSSRPLKSRIILGIAASVFFMVLFLKLTYEVFEQKKIQIIDQNILKYIGSNIRKPYLNGLAVDITTLGSPSYIIIISIIAIALLWISKDRIGAIFFSVSVSSGTCLMLILKKIISRPRPIIISHLVEAQGQSFPSGHSLMASITYLALAIILSRHIKSYKIIFFVFIFNFLIIFLIALSRLYLGIHYPSDVLSGIFFGFSWVFILAALFTKKFKFS